MIQKLTTMSVLCVAILANGWASSSISAQGIDRTETRNSRSQEPKGSGSHGTDQKGTENKGSGGQGGSGGGNGSNGPAGGRTGHGNLGRIEIKSKIELSSKKPSGSGAHGSLG